MRKTNFTLILNYKLPFDIGTQHKTKWIDLKHTQMNLRRVSGVLSLRQAQCTLQRNVWTLICAFENDKSFNHKTYFFFSLCVISHNHEESLDISY